VTGGCGYIGSHTIVDLIQHGFEVISADSLINSDESVLDGIEAITGVRIKNYKIDLAEAGSLKQIPKEEYPINGVIHFAALKAVSESMKFPMLYYQNNLQSLLEVLNCMKETDIPYMIFSSSCTVYGSEPELPVNETMSFKPCSSPYGRTKQMGELILQDVLPQFDKKAISLRYFNPAGAHESVLIGEASTNPALNLVPIMTETAIGKRKEMMVYGTDYNTPDGSCIRDYIHVMDVARAHTQAIQLLIDGRQQDHFDAINLGIEKGMSVFEIINAFERINNVSINYKTGARRLGDIDEIYADISKAKKVLNWQPVFSINDILSSAWKWEKQRG
jgi:UDP-glucose 4-epimerase